MPMLNKAPATMPIIVACQRERSGTLCVVRSECPADGRGYSSSHGTVRERLLKHNDRKHDGNAGKRRCTETPDVSGFSD